MQLPKLGFKPMTPGQKTQAVPSEPCQQSKTDVQTQIHLPGISVRPLY